MASDREFIRFVCEQLQGALMADLDDPQYLAELARTTAGALPNPKPKARKKRRTKRKSRRG
jgi:hypothetical protein